MILQICMHDRSAGTYFLNDKTDAPTATSLQEEINQFYNILGSILTLVPKKDAKVIMGDWNEKVGDENTSSEEVMGTY